MTDQTSRNGTNQAIAYTTAASSPSTAFGTQTRQVRIVSTSACHYVISGSPTATTSDPLLPASWVEYRTVTPGQKISAIRAGTGGLITATDGTIHVTEMTN